MSFAQATAVFENFLESSFQFFRQNLAFLLGYFIYFKEFPWFDIAE